MLRSPVSLAAVADPAGQGSEVVSHLQRTALFRDYQRAFETATGLPLTLRAAGSTQPPLHGSKRLNLFCALLRQRRGSCAACLQLQQRVEGQAMLQPKTLECFAGLNETAVPVRVGAILVGFLQTGQIFLRPPTRRRFAALLRAHPPARNEAERRELEVAYFQTRRVGRGSYDSIVRLLSIFAQHLGAVANEIVVREASAELPAMTRARAFIAAHQSEDVRLRDVARAVNLSTFYFCKLFKKTTGLTFTNYLGRRRIAVVKVQLLQVHARVTDTAYAAGFQSLSQFNRVFHRVVGESPSVFRERLHAPAPLALVEVA